MANNKDRREIDFIIETEDEIYGIEVKCCTHFYYDVFLSTFDKIIYNTICFLQYLK